METKIDYSFLFLIIFFLFLGFLFLSLISFPQGLLKFSDGYFFIKHQILFGLLPGIFLGILVFKIPKQILKKTSLYLFLFVFFLSFLTLSPLGSKIYGAKRWIKILGVSFQPTEFLKIALIIYISSLLSKKINLKKDKSYFKIIYFNLFAIIFLLSPLFILQPDISSLFVILLSLWGIYFISGAPLGQIFSLFFVFILGGLLLMISAPYRILRILAFFNPKIDPLGSSYQIHQALIAIGSGGILGKGLGNSLFKFGLLPQPFTDTIFAIICEEIGFGGALFLISLFLFFIFKGIKISLRAPTKFERLLSSGVIIWLASQFFINIGGLLNLIPLSGIPLPFFSYGGSHLTAELIGVSLLLKISKKKI